MGFMFVVDREERELRIAAWLVRSAEEARQEKENWEHAKGQLLGYPSPPPRLSGLV
jgi:hypothetical protein